MFAMLKIEEAEEIDTLIAHLKRHGFEKKRKGTLRIFLLGIAKRETLFRDLKSCANLTRILLYLSIQESEKELPRIKDVAAHIQRNYAGTLIALREFQEQHLIEFVRHPSSTFATTVYGLKIMLEGRRVLEILENSYRAYQNA